MLGRTRRRDRPRPYWALGKPGREASERQVSSQVGGIKRSPPRRVIPPRGRRVIEVVAGCDVAERGVGGAARAELIEHGVGKSQDSAATTGRKMVLVENRRKCGPRRRGGAGAADHVPAGRPIAGGVDRVPASRIGVERDVGHLSRAVAIRVSNAGTYLPAGSRELLRESAATSQRWRVRGPRPRGFGSVAPDPVE